MCERREHTRVCTCSMGRRARDEKLSQPHLQEGKWAQGLDLAARACEAAPTSAKTDEARAAKRACRLSSVPAPAPTRGGERETSPRAAQRQRPPMRAFKCRERPVESRARAKGGGSKGRREKGQGRVGGRRHHGARAAAGGKRRVCFGVEEGRKRHTGSGGRGLSPRRQEEQSV